jgi:hypothetical protein
LVPLWIEFLAKVPVVMDQRHSGHSDVEIGGGPKRVSSQNAETAAVSGDIGIERDFHREIRNSSRRWVVCVRGFGGVTHRIFIIITQYDDSITASFPTEVPV